MSTVAEDLEQLLRVKDVTKLLQISRATLWELEQRGMVTPVRIGRSVRFRPSDIRRLLDGEPNRGGERKRRNPRQQLGASEETPPFWGLEERYAKEPTHETG